MESNSKTTKPVVANSTEVNKNKIVWFFGPPTAGKSWSADFCAKYHGWNHIDGDEELMRMNPKTFTTVWKGCMIQFEKCLEDKAYEPPRESYAPYLTDLVNKTKQARAANPDQTVAVAFALYRKCHRDFVREITGEPVSFVQIEVTRDEVVARNMPRVEDFCKEAGVEPAEAWKMWQCHEQYGEYTGIECWTKMFLAIDFIGSFGGITAGEPDSFIIDSGLKSAGTLPGLEKCLGLPHI